MATQDLPPPGGFDPIRYKRNLPARGPNGLLLFGGIVAMMGFGFYMLRVTSDERWELKQEKVRRRLALVPLLMAEEEEKYRAWKVAFDREEEELMKGRKDWQMHAKVYHTDRFVKPYVLTPREAYPY